MGAEVDMWVEVEFVVKQWVKSYGVTGEDAILNVSEISRYKPTGRVTYSDPWEDSLDETD
jgi:hypothetical protein